jgi:hypothetical protein
MSQAMLSHDNVVAGKCCRMKTLSQSEASAVGAPVSRGAQQ